MKKEYQMLYITELMEKIADEVIPEEKKLECPICKSKINVFLPFGVNPRPNAQCPVCGALERHRALWMFCEDRHMFNRGGDCSTLPRRKSYTKSFQH